MSDGNNIGRIIEAAPIPEKWKREVLPLFLTPHDMKRILGWEFLYRQVLDVQGEFFQFGVGYGRDLNIWACLRYWLEPTVPRRYIGFDTFDGIQGEDIRDWDGPKAEDGYYGFPESEAFINFLIARLRSHADKHPSNDRRPFDLVQGKVQDTLPIILEEYKGTIALASFDMCVGEPTRAAMELICDRLPSGAILAFNQWHTPGWTGESAAFGEVFGFPGMKIRKVPSHPYWAYVVMP